MAFEEKETQHLGVPVLDAFVGASRKLDQPVASRRRQLLASLHAGKRDHRNAVAFALIGGEYSATCVQFGCWLFIAA